MVAAKTNYDHDAFGAPLPVTTSESVEQRYTYTGREASGVAGGPMYYRYRGYEEELGRFGQRDPIGYVAGVNCYSYARNQGYQLVDPYGLEESSRPYLLKLDMIDKDVVFNEVGYTGQEYKVSGTHHYSWESFEWDYCMCWHVTNYMDIDIYNSQYEVEYYNRITTYHIHLMASGRYDPGVLKKALSGTSLTSTGAGLVVTLGGLPGGLTLGAISLVTGATAEAIEGDVHLKLKIDRFYTDSTLQLDRKMTYWRHRHKVVSKSKTSRPTEYSYTECLSADSIARKNTVSFYDWALSWDPSLRADLELTLP